MYFEKWYPVDLVRLPAHIQDVGMMLFVGDADSIRIGVNVTRNGAEETVTGAVKGIVILPDGSDILPFNGSSDGSRAWIDLPGTALVMSGRVQIALRVYDDGAVTTLLAVSATVRRADADRHFDPDDVVGDITELISEAERVSGVAETAADQAQAALEQASNIVSYEAQSGQTDAEKASARGNINAADAGLVDALHGLIDYGYDTPWDNATQSDGKLVTRQGMRYVINGSSETTAIARVPLNNNAFYPIGSSWPSSAVVSHPITMTPGQKLRVRMHILSGSQSFSESWTGGTVSVRWLWDGSATVRGTFMPTMDGNYSDIVYDAEHPVVHPILYIPRANASAVYDNLVVEVVVCDISNGALDLPETPTTDGTYTLKVSIANGVPTYAWVQDGASLLSTPLTLGGESE